MMRVALRLFYVLTFGTVFITHALFAQTVVEVLSEDFDSVTVPDLPAGWAASGDGWVTSTSVSSPGSGENNLAHIGSSEGNVTSTPIDFSGIVSATLQYLARRTTTYDQYNLSLSASIDGGAIFPITVLEAGAALPVPGGDYSTISVALPGEVLGASDVIFRFEALGGSTGSANIRIDDILVTGTRSDLSLDFSETSLAFSAPAGESQDKLLMISNPSSENITIASPELTGAAFSVQPTSGVTLEPGETFEYTITFSPVDHGTFEGQIVFSYDSGETVIGLTGTTTNNGYGFTEGASSTLEESSGIEVPLTLQYSGNIGLQGMQFFVGWDPAYVELTDVIRGDAVADTETWLLSYEAGENSVDVLLLAQGTDGLVEGSYDSLVILEMDSGTIAPLDELDVTFSLTDVLGALAIPDGGDAGLNVLNAQHTLSLTRRKAFFNPSSWTVDIEPTQAGETGQASLTVSNPGGTKALDVTGVSSSNVLFSIDLAGATVLPDETQTFTISFTPTATNFGLQEGSLTFNHNGEVGPTSVITLTGVGQRGRGDTDGDGIVDVMDLVDVIDLVLERRIPDGSELASGDVYPFSEGDGELDVRDLTVLAQAIARGMWPDDIMLPVEVQPAGSSTASEKGNSGSVQVQAVPETGGMMIYLEHEQPITAFQLVLHVGAFFASPAIVLDEARKVQSLALIHSDADARVIRLLYARTDGRDIAPGRYPFALIPQDKAPAEIASRYATAVDADRNRIQVDVMISSPTDTDNVSTLPGDFRMMKPYPNPFRSGTGQTLQIPLVLAESAPIQISVYDVLGRHIETLGNKIMVAGNHTVTWAGKDRHNRPLVPGLYLLQAKSGKHQSTRTLLIVR